MIYRYDFDGDIALDAVQELVAASAMTNKAVGTLSAADGQVEVHFDNELSPADEALLAEIAAAAPLYWSKKAKKAAIDAKTDAILLSGTTYNGRKFSLSMMAQSTWLGMYMAKDFLTYPFPVSTQDGGAYEMANVAEVQAFFLTCVARINAAIASGRAFKVEVNAANTVAEVEAVTDNR